jgi:hypothetical protein
VAEETADLRRAARNATQSNIERCLEHLVNLAASPANAPKGTWRREARASAKTARRNFSPAMRQHLDMAEAWGRRSKRPRTNLSITARDRSATLGTVRSPWTMSSMPGSTWTRLSRAFSPVSEPRRRAAEPWCGVLPAEHSVVALPPTRSSARACAPNE